MLIELFSLKMSWFFNIETEMVNICSDLRALPQRKTVRLKKKLWPPSNDLTLSFSSQFLLNKYEQAKNCIHKEYLNLQRIFLFKLVHGSNLKSSMLSTSVSYFVETRGPGPDFCKRPLQEDEEMTFVIFFVTERNWKLTYFGSRQIRKNIWM